MKNDKDNPSSLPFLPAHPPSNNKVYLPRVVRHLFVRLQVANGQVICNVCGIKVHNAGNSPTSCIFRNTRDDKRTQTVLSSLTSTSCFCVLDLPSQQRLPSEPDGTVPLLLCHLCPLQNKYMARLQRGMQTRQFLGDAVHNLCD